MKRRISLFWSVVLTVVGLYLLLALLAPYISMLLVGRDEPLPIPSALMTIYMTLILIGVAVYWRPTTPRLDEFLAPVKSFLIGPEGKRVDKGSGAQHRALGRACSITHTSLRHCLSEFCAFDYGSCHTAHRPPDHSLRVSGPGEPISQP